VVISRLAYRKGVDLLVASAPRVCAKFPNVRFLIGGDGPKMINLLQMREKYMLQDRIELIGAVDHSDVRSVLIRGSIYLNTSLTEAFGIGLLEAACAGLYVVSTKVGGVPEVLPEDMVSFAHPNEAGKWVSVVNPGGLTNSFFFFFGVDVVRALTKAIAIVSAGDHDPVKAHERVKSMYDWEEVTKRTEVVYNDIVRRNPIDLWTRMHRYVCQVFVHGSQEYNVPFRTLRLGPFAGIIYFIILVVECLFFLVLEWAFPREDIHYVKEDWKMVEFSKVRLYPLHLRPGCR